MFGDPEKAACAALLHHYAVVRDAGDAEAAAACFGPDAVLTVGDMVVEGRGAISEWVGNAHDCLDTRHHMTTLDMVATSDEEVRAESYAIVFEFSRDGAAGQSARIPAISSVQYRDLLRKVGGKWYIERRQLTRFARFAGD